MRALVVGAGRMGRRHVRGLLAAGVEVAVADPGRDARQEAGVGETYETLEDALGHPFDAAVLAETADGRLERFAAVAAAGVPHVLLEKPLEQSRARVRLLAEEAARSAVDARVNHWFRTTPLFRELRDAGGPFDVEVTGGAFGLACNGIHWLDLALFLTDGSEGTLLWGEVEETPIGSGRGERFRDYGGRAVFGFADGSRLALASRATSSAPLHAVVVQPDRETVVLPHEERALLAERSGASALPPYRYGAEYERRELDALAGDELWRATERWARALAAGEAPELPSVADSVAAHDLLFDLLEVTGDERFPVT